MLGHQRGVGGYRGGETNVLVYLGGSESPRFVLVVQGVVDVAEALTPVLHVQFVWLFPIDQLQFCHCINEFHFSQGPLVDLEKGGEPGLDGTRLNIAGLLQLFDLIFFSLAHEAIGRESIPSQAFHGNAGAVGAQTRSLSHNLTCSHRSQFGGCLLFACLDASLCWDMHQFGVPLGYLELLDERVDVNLTFAEHKVLR